MHKCLYLYQIFFMYDIYVILYAHLFLFLFIFYSTKQFNHHTYYLFYFHQNSIIINFLMYIGSKEDQILYNYMHLS